MALVKWFDNKIKPHLNLCSWFSSDEYYFPEEILIQILVKLSADRVWLCRAVCRQWNSVIRNLHLGITNQPLNHHNRTNKISFITFTTTSSCWNALGIYQGGLGFEGKKRRKMRIRRVHLPMTRAEFRFLRLIGSWDGLLMFDKFHAGFTYEFHRCYILVLNPYTGEKRVIKYPLEGRRGYICGFYFDRFRHEYNLLHFWKGAQGYHSFSFTEGVWRRIYLASSRPVNYDCPPCTHTSPPVHVADALHWLTDCAPPFLSKRVLAFKIETKDTYYFPAPTSVTFPPPRAYYNGSCEVCTSRLIESHEEKVQLIEKNGKLCFCHMIKQGSRIDIWMLEEYGNWSSWVRRFQVVFPPHVPISYKCLSSREWGPTILSFPDGDVIAVKWNHKNIYLYHLLTHKSTSIDDARMFRYGFHCEVINYGLTAFNKTLLSPNIYNSVL